MSRHPKQETESKSQAIAFGNLWNNGRYETVDKASKVTWDRDVRALGEAYLSEDDADQESE